jgi:hypothetical protein
VGCGLCLGDHVDQYRFDLDVFPSQELVLARVRLQGIVT